MTVVLSTVAVVCVLAIWMLQVRRAMAVAKHPYRNAQGGAPGASSSRSGWERDTVDAYRRGTR